MYSASELNKSNVFLRSISLQNFDAYKEREALCSRESVVTAEGTLVDASDLELRRHPPNVEIDNRSHPTETVITIDSANRPGTLVEVVQCLTELNLMVKGAQISSDGGWFIDVFNVEEQSGGKVIDHKKLETIKQVLKIEYEGEQHPSPRFSHDERSRIHTVIEMADEDQIGLLHDITMVIYRAGLDTKSLAAWTQCNRAAMVIGAVTQDGPLRSQPRIDLLKRDLLRLLSDNGRVTIKNVKGSIHHERRLHRLLLQEAQRCPSSLHSNGHTTEGQDNKDITPEVMIDNWQRLKYWRVAILCKDRTKLLFDTLCTLADLDYDVYHASVTSHADQDTASQDFYIRPRYGEIGFDCEKAEHLKHLLTASILRREPHGLKVLILTMDQLGFLCRVADMFKSARLRVTRAIVKCLTDDKGFPTRQAVHTFFIQIEDGFPALADNIVELLTSQGGQLTSHLTEDRIPTKLESKNKFAFNILDWSRRFGLQDTKKTVAF